MGGPTIEKKKQYLGRWDSALGQMIYECLEEAPSDLMLEKDPRDNTYHPLVVPRSKEQCPVVSNFNTDNLKLERKSPEVNLSCSNKQVWVKPP